MIDAYSEMLEMNIAVFLPDSLLYGSDMIQKFLLTTPMMKFSERIRTEFSIT